MINVNLKLDIEGFLEESFNNELEALVENYTGIDSETKEKLKRLGELIKESGNESYKPNLWNAIELAKEEDKVIQMHLWLRTNIDINSINNAREIMEDIDENGYCNVHDEYLLAYKGANLDEMHRGIFEELLEDADYVEMFFTKERLAEMWVESTSEREAVNELLSIENPLEELLGVNLEEVLEFTDGEKLIFGRLEY